MKEAHWVWVALSALATIAGVYFVIKGNLLAAIYLNTCALIIGRAT